MNYSIIKELANEKNFSIRKLCLKIGISEQGLHAAIRNNTLKIRDLEKIANVLGVNIEYFFKENSNIDISGQVQIGNGNKQNMNYADRFKDMEADNRLLKEKIKGLQNEVLLLKEMNDILKNK